MTMPHMTDIPAKTQFGIEMEDLTESIMQGLREVYAHQRGEIYLPTFDEFVKELEDERM